MALLIGLGASLLSEATPSGRSVLIGRSPGAELLGLGLEAGEALRRAAAPRGRGARAPTRAPRARPWRAARVQSFGSPRSQAALRLRPAPRVPRHHGLPGSRLGADRRYPDSVPGTDRLVDPAGAEEALQSHFKPSLGRALPEDRPDAGAPGRAHRLITTQRQSAPLPQARAHRRRDDPRGSCSPESPYRPPASRRRAPLSSAVRYRV